MPLLASSGLPEGSPIECEKALRRWNYTQVLIASNSEFPQMNAMIQLSVLAHFLNDLSAVSDTQSLIDDPKQMGLAVLKFGQAMSRLHLAHGIPHKDSQPWEKGKDLIEHRVLAPRLHALLVSPYYRVGPRMIETLLSRLLLEREGRPLHANFQRYIELKLYRTQTLKAYLHHLLGPKITVDLFQDLRQLAQSLQSFSKLPEVQLLAEEHQKLLKNRTGKGPSRERLNLSISETEAQLRKLYENHLHKNLKNYLSNSLIKDFYQISTSQF